MIVLAAGICQLQAGVGTGRVGSRDSVFVCSGSNMILDLSLDKSGLGNRGSLLLEVVCGVPSELRMVNGYIHREQYCH